MNRSTQLCQFSPLSSVMYFDLLHCRDIYQERVVVNQNNKSDYIPNAIKIIAYYVILNLKKSGFFDMSKSGYDSFLVFPKIIWLANLNTRLIYSKLTCPSAFCISIARFYSQYVTALNDPNVLLCFRPIRDVRTHDTNEGNTYTNNPDRIATDDTLPSCADVFLFL